MYEFKINSNKTYKIDWDKVQQSENALANYLALIQIIFDELPITFSGEIVKKYGLEKIVKEFK